MLETLARHWMLMNGMAQRVGVDLGAEFVAGNLTRDVLRQAVFSCTHCTDIEGCKRFIAGECAAAQEMPDFCQMKPLLKVLAARHNAHN